MPRELIEPRKGKKCHARRDTKVESAEELDVGRSLAQRVATACCIAAVILAACSSDPDFAGRTAYAEPGCRPVEKVIEVNGQPETVHRRECQQPDGSWRSVQ
jgi:hypothetical protein